MAKHPSSNGSGKIDIHQVDMGGWVRVFASLVHPIPDELPIFLSHSLTEWFRTRPQLTLRAVLPVTRGGETMELHAWYDLHVFPDASGQVPTPR